MCKRSDQDAGWCLAHHADFLPAALACEAVLRPDAGRGRPRADRSDDGWVARAQERRLSPMSALPTRRI